MNAEDVLTHLEALLGEEHAALRAMKAMRVGELASEKEIWFTHLVDSGAFTRPDLKGRIRDLHGRMQKNALLITFARDITREALTTLGATMPVGYGRQPDRGVAWPAPGRNLSTTG